MDIVKTLVTGEAKFYFGVSMAKEMPIIGCLRSTPVHGELMPLALNRCNKCFFFFFFRLLNDRVNI